MSAHTVQDITYGKQLLWCMHIIILVYLSGTNRNTIKHTRVLEKNLIKESEIHIILLCRDLFRGEEPMTFFPSLLYNTTFFNCS